MKRGFDEEFRRRENFNILQSETINKIPGMSDDEKKHWLDLPHKMKLYSKYDVACRYHKYRVSRELAMKYEKNLKRRMIYTLGIVAVYVVYFIYMKYYKVIPYNFCFWN